MGKKAMLSQPMAGKTEEEIVATRERAIRCGNYLQLGQLSGNVRRWNCLHFVVTTNPAGNLMNLDKLCPPQVGADVVTGVTVTTAA